MLMVLIQPYMLSVVPAGMGTLQACSIMPAIIQNYHKSHPLFQILTMYTSVTLISHPVGVNLTSESIYRLLDGTPAVNHGGTYRTYEIIWHRKNYLPCQLQLG